MALVTDITCKECGITKHEVTNYSGVCQECRGKISNKKRRIYLSGLKGLSLEERIEKLETAIYDLNAENRLVALESMNQQY